MRIRFVFVVLLPLVLWNAACTVDGRRATPSRPVAASDETSKWVGCQLLRIDPTTKLKAPIVVPDGGILCSHGSVVQILPSSRQVATIAIAQSATNGPDCNLTFTVGASTYVVNVQQDVCEYEAGKVAARVVTGDATIVATTIGSLHQKTPGTVQIALH